MCQRHPSLAAVNARALLGCALVVWGAGCATAPRYTRPSSRGPAGRPAHAVRGGADRGGRSHALTGRASYYGPGFHGKKTANGETFDMHAMTAAHKTLPFGTRVRVENTDNGKSVVVRINDRGPYKKGRIIDLSFGAGRKIGLDVSGVAHVRLEILK